MNVYLTRLRAINSKKGIPGQPSIPSKPSSEGFEGEPSSGVLKNHGERCLQCGVPIGPGGRDITVRSTGTGRLASVHQDCLEAWQRRGVVPMTAARVAAMKRCAIASMQTTNKPSDRR